MSKSNGIDIGITPKQIQADIFLAEKALEESQKSDRYLAKYLRGQSGYHLQQAAEKLIKYQIYHFGVSVKNTKMYKHEIGALLSYAKELCIEISVPAYIEKNAEIITSWEAEGRYDIHVVVRMDTLTKCYNVMNDWFGSIFENNK